MRRLLIVSVFYLMALLASGQPVSEIRISEEYDGKDLIFILQDVGTKYNIALFFLDEWIPPSTKNLNFRDEPLSSALKMMLNGTDLNYVFYDQSIIIAPNQLLGKEITQAYYMVKAKQQAMMQSQKWATASDIITVGDSTIST